MNTKNKIKVSAALIMLVLASFGLYYVASNKISSLSDLKKKDQISKETEILKKDTQILVEFMQNSTEENRAKYINYVDQTLTSEGDSLSQQAKDYLLLRKATNLSVLRGDHIETDIREANKIYNDFIAKYRNSQNQSEQVLRAYAIIGLVRLNGQCCFNIDFTASGFPEYQNYESYKAKLPASPQAVKSLTFIDLLKSVPEVIAKNDRSYQAEMMQAIKTLITRCYVNSLDEAKCAEIKQISKELIDNRSNSQLITYKDYLNAELIPAYTYPQFLMMYYRLNSPDNFLTVEQKSEVQREFDKAFVMFDNAKTIVTDKIGLAQTYNFFFVQYATSLLSDGTLDGSQFDKNNSEHIEEFITNMKSHPDIETQFKTIIEDAKKNLAENKHSTRVVILTSLDRSPRLHEYFTKDLGFTYTVDHKSNYNLLKNAQ